MRKKTAVILCLILLFAVNDFAIPPSCNIIKTDIVTISVEQQYERVQPGSKSALAIHFELQKDWHFYASAKTAPGGMNLKIKPSFPSYIDFSEPIFPEAELYLDGALEKKLEVFSGNFTVFLPFTVSQDIPKMEGPRNTLVKIKIEGAVCSGVQCRMPDFGNLGTVIKIAHDAVISEAKFTLPVEVPFGKAAETIRFEWGITSAWGALLLALLAGLSLNIMPCVWPVLPLIVMRIVEQAKQGKGKSTALGLAFCSGILLFFACLAGANIILQLFYGTVLQWGDQFRNPAVVAGMALLLVVLALFCFGVFTIGVPSGIAGKSGSGKGYPGAVGMGFLAAILSTPCSFAILAAAFAWAQTQKLLLATVVIMVIGVGMAVPYAILTSMPGLLNRLPKPGRWMELFKQAIGFVLLAIAVKLIAALPEVRRMSILYFAVTVGFCVWMWGSWVNYKTKTAHKRLIRIIAVVLTVAAGWMFLPAPAGELIDWQPYDADLIETAIAEERPVLIKFTADWCLNCLVVDKMVYSRKDVAKLIEERDVLAIKADTTKKDNPASLDFKNVYNELSLPVSMLFVPGQEETVRWRGKFFFADELKTLLENFSSK